MPRKQTPIDPRTGKPRRGRPPNERDPDMLAPRQYRFAEEYVVDLNAERAALAAGYSARSARAMGFKLLAIPKVRRVVDQLKAERSKRTATDADWVLQEARRLYERAMGDIRPAVDRRGKQLVDDEGRACFVFNGTVAARALELVGKHVQVQAFEERIVLDVSEIERTRRAQEMGNKVLSLLDDPDVIEGAARPVEPPKPRHRRPAAIAGALVQIKPSRART